MKSKLLTVLLGVIASFVLLYFLDPYITDFGIVILDKSKSPSSPERGELLSRLQNSEAWKNFRPFEIPGGSQILERRRESSGENPTSSKYAVMAPRSLIRDLISVRLTGDPKFETIFDAVYTTDEFARRTTIAPELTGTISRAAVDRQIAFLGCSFTWGSGVNDDETFSSVVARSIPAARVVNLGIRGGAPNDFIDDLLENPARLQKDEFEHGVVVLTLIGDHLERSLCKTRCYTEPVQFKTAYAQRPFRLDKTRYILKKGELVSAGLFRDEAFGLPLLKTLYFKSRILTKLYYETSGYPTDEDLFLFAKMVERIRDIVVHRTGYEFYVAFFPDQETISTPKILKNFEQLGISYFDYSKLRFNEALQGRAFFAIDGHPTALGNAAYAELLMNDLKTRHSKIFAPTATTDSPRRDASHPVRRTSGTRRPSVRR